MGGSRPTVWITRTLPGGALTAARVQALGWTPWPRPLLTVRPLDVPITLVGVGALAFTSPNGVAAFSRLRDERALPVFAVGDGTADAARAAGFNDVQSAAGDVHDLVSLILARRETFSGVLLRPGAREPAGDLDGALAARGVEAASWAIYETVETSTDPNGPEMRRLASGELAAVLVHSPRAGRRLAGLIREPVAARIICISVAAATPLIEVGCTVVVAGHPSENSVLAALGSALPASQRPPGELG